MREVTASGQTIEEAIESALKQLNLKEEETEIEVIDEGKKGFLGIFGSTRAIVKVRVKRDVIEETKQYLEKIAVQMGVDVGIEAEKKGDRVYFDLSGDKIAILIGKRGRTLNALQYLAQLVINKRGNYYLSVVVDAEGYRERREATLIDLAQKMESRAKRLNRKVALEPMPAYERKIIHSALQDSEEVTTYSDGVEPHRHIIIKP